MPDKVYQIQFKTSADASGAESVTLATRAVAQAATEAAAAAGKATMAMVRQKEAEKAAADEARALADMEKYLASASSEAADAAGDKALAGAFGNLRARLAAVKTEIASTREELGRLDKQMEALHSGSFGSGGGAQNTGGFLGAKGTAGGSDDGDPMGALVGGLSKRSLGLAALAGTLKNIVSGMIGPELQKLSDAWKGTLRTFSEEAGLGLPIQQLTGWFNDLTGATAKATAEAQNKANVDAMAALKAKEVARAEEDHKTALDRLTQSQHEAARNAQRLLEMRRSQIATERELADLNAEAANLRANDPTRQIPDEQRAEERGKARIEQMKAEFAAQRALLDAQEAAAKTPFNQANANLEQARAEAQKARAKMEGLTGDTSQRGEVEREKARAEAAGAEERRNKAYETQKKALEDFNAQKGKIEDARAQLRATEKARLDNAEQATKNEVQVILSKKMADAEKQIEADQKKNAEKQQKRSDEERRNADESARKGLRAGLSPEGVANAEMPWLADVGKDAAAQARSMRDRSPNGATTAAITDVEKAAKAVSDGATPAEMQALADAMRKLADNMRSYSDAVKATVNDLKRSTEAANQELARRVNEIQSTSGNSGF